MNDTVWILNDVSEKARQVALDLDIPVKGAQILVNRGIDKTDEAEKFLHGTLRDLYDPYLMEGMRIAVDRIRKAISQKEKILIFGDYDVDGILSVVSLSKALRTLGGDVDFFIPDRLKEGYGLKEKYIDHVLQKRSNLVISVDCGIKAVGFVDRAKQHGIDVIITDHHQPGPLQPSALAVLNPALPDSRYPYKCLAGIGVVFKLIQALFGVEDKSSQLPHYLKLVSLGTVADIVELKDENRIFVKFGLKALEKVANIGLRSLMDSCGIRGRKVSVGDVGFRIGPRLNAAGRMGLTDLAVQLFFSDTPQEADEIVSRLDKLNSKRQRIEEKVFSQAKSLIKKRDLDKRYKLLLLGCEEWHRGVLGIVASKIKDLYYRPVILFAYQDRKAYGSGRSIQEFSLIDCLNRHKEMFLNYGGHTMAVGCEMNQESMKPLKKAINAFVASRISEDQLKRKLYIDAKIDFGEINFSLLDILASLSPFGLGNPRPLFLTEKAVVATQPRKIQGKHSKFLVKKNGRVFEGLGWGKGEWADQISAGDRIDMVYTLQMSEYLGEERLNLSLEDIRRS